MTVLLISIYILICLLIILYTIFYAISLRSQSKHQSELTAEFSKSLGELPLEDLNNQKWQTLIKRVASAGRNINRLYCYDAALQKYTHDEKWAEIYFSQMVDSYVKLADYYHNHSIKERVYFIQHVAQYARFIPNRQLFEQLIAFMNRKNVIERESVLQALYGYGDISLIKQAFQLITSKNKFHHSKLIADGLLKVTIPNDELADLLWQDFSSYPESIQIGIVKYIQGVSDNYKERFFHYLENGEGSLDVRLNMLRYFHTHPYQPLYPQLLSLLKGTNGGAVQYRVVAAFTLAAYPSEQTVEELKQALKDYEWYVRVNASKSLVALNVPMSQLIEILNGDDRYASEMLAYQLTEMEEGRNE